MQPDDPLFDTVYPWHKKQREERKEAEEKAKWEQEQKQVRGQRKKFRRLSLDNR